MTRIGSDAPAESSGVSRGLAELARRLVQPGTDPVLITDADRVILAASEAAATLLSEPADRLTGCAIERFLTWTEPAALNGRPWRHATTLVTVPSTGRVVAVASTALFDGDRRLGMVATLRDVTAPGAAQAQLTRSEQRFRLLFESAGVAVMTLDGDGRLAGLNHAAEELTQFAREELLGTPFRRLIPPDLVEATVEELRRWSAGGAGQIETALCRRDGEIRRVALVGAGSAPGGELACLIRDLTAETRLHERLAQSEKMAALGQMVSGVAHEINNPLASISAFAQILVDQPDLTPDDRHSAEIIFSEARRAARIVNKLLTFARRHEATRAPAQLNGVLQDTLDLRAYDLRARGIGVDVELDPAIGELVVDRFQLQQVFLNLLNNAEYAMASVERPRHTLSVRTRSVATGARIEIEDSGSGIPADLRGKIFTPFFTTKPPGSGTGLGLSISRGIIEEHGGSIWVEEAGGGGARFCVEIPYADRAAPAPRNAPATPTPPAVTLRILIADDEEAIRQALGRFLTSCGHEVVTTGLGAEALALARAGNLDAVILDIRMPDLSGTEVFKRLSGERPGLAERVLFITGDIGDELSRFLSASGRPYLIKPFELGALLPVLPRERLAESGGDR